MCYEENEKLLIIRDDFLCLMAIGLFIELWGRRLWSSSLLFEPEPSVSYLLLSMGTKK